jgi:hypothetical protein
VSATAEIVETAMARADSETTVTAGTAAMTVGSQTVESAIATRTVDARVPRLAAATDLETVATVVAVVTVTD